MLKKLRFVLGFAIFVFLAYAIYTQVTKTSCRSLRLECQKETVVFERVYFKEKVHAFQEAIRTQGLVVDLETQKSHYAPSKLFERLDLNEVRNILIREFGETPSKDSLRLHVLIYENDPLDPGKKTKEAKLYAGYVVFSFFEGADLVYKIQIDFMDKKGEDIAKRIACAKASLMALEG
ncbi:MAG: hypothetical protein JW802_02895 [Campylobacterales bacterium]|nr:hypothetical protein [Campylobacterales bacterium]MBN2832284.1 hypothetical protein [Campylobacterales bacterium]